ncbi:MAG: L-asparaginase 1 [Candidatus Magasanikbacteria bacterium CG11_big_fil_rev_8_21_14_0_20_39_34]|uniref:L-asparaginase 1 n=1 Tax=Candidatus Magasanikbacteria bacterium CG11_big_fil_rev_8_21_14_0_20_39_34 TaxID=1974653 RepID=A0A2H0N6R2_9BACT|nr:MAG: L-asparaginase 1 [Candidatus Magasanikbacteria bacterium CG11_big_fil_rev_8_21_14_0_20_39_34]
MKPHILLIFAGGTIGMVPNKDTGALQPAESALELMKQIPELEEIATLDIEVVANIDSSNMTPEHWVKISHTINDNYSKYDGFVVAQGSDTMAYTASALSFALQGLGKPVIFTGSLIPLQKAGSDARNNLVYACMTAALDLAEVCIVLSHTILRGNRAKKHHESFVAAFHSPNFPNLGELGRPITLHSWRNKRNNSSPLTLHADFDENIAVIRLFPGFPPKIIDSIVAQGTHALIIEGFGPGNVPFLNTSIIPSIQKAISHGIPVIISNQMEEGTTNLHAYEAGLEAQKAGAISSGDMTIEATITKTMWALANSDKSIKSIKAILEKDISGELSE